MKLQRLGVILALLILGPVLVSLFKGFESAITQPAALLGGIVLGGGMVFIFQRVALVPDSGHTSWAQTITGRNARYLFGLLLLVWVAAMAFLASMNLTPNENGAPALVGLFVGFFIFMGFIWSVIGE